MRKSKHENSQMAEIPSDAADTLALIGSKIRELRLAKRMTLQDLAVRSRVAAALARAAA